MEVWKLVGVVSGCIVVYIVETARHVHHPGASHDDMQVLTAFVRALDAAGVPRKPATILYVRVCLISQDPERVIASLLTTCCTCGCVSPPQLLYVWVCQFSPVAVRVGVSNLIVRGMCLISHDSVYGLGTFQDQMPCTSTFFRILFRCMVFPSVKIEWSNREKPRIRHNVTPIPNT